MVGPCRRRGVGRARIRESRGVELGDAESGQLRAHGACSELACHVDSMAAALLGTALGPGSSWLPLALPIILSSLAMRADAQL